MYYLSPSELMNCIRNYVDWSYGTHIEEVGEVLSRLPALGKEPVPHACQCPGVPSSGPFNVQISHNP